MDTSEKTGTTDDMVYVDDTLGGSYTVSCHTRQTQDENTNSGSRDRCGLEICWQTVCSDVCDISQIKLTSNVNLGDILPFHDVRDNAL